MEYLSFSYFLVLKVSRSVPCVCCTVSDVVNRNPISAIIVQAHNYYVISS